MHSFSKLKYSEFFKCFTVFIPLGWKQGDQLQGIKYLKNMYNNPVNSYTWSIRSTTCCGPCCIYVAPTNCNLQAIRPTKHPITYFLHSSLTLTAAAHVSFLGCPVEIFDGRSGNGADFSLSTTDLSLVII